MKRFVTLLSGAALLAAAAAPAAFAQNLPEVQVTARAPTEVRISLVGKAASAVRQEIHAAAATVCRNAVINRELEFYDVSWCRSASAIRALNRYAQIRSRNPTLAAGAAIVLSAN